MFGIVLPGAICLRLRYSASEPFPYLRVHGGSGSGAESPLRTQPAARASRQDYTTALTDADTPDVRTNATVLVPPAPQSLHRRASAAANSGRVVGSLPSTSGCFVRCVGCVSLNSFVIYSLPCEYGFCIGN